VNGIECGYSLIRSFLSDRQLSDLQRDLADLKLASHSGGIRNANKKFRSIAKLAESDNVLNLAQSYLVQPPQLVRAILFDKTESNNWYVTWHQDKTVAVSSKFNRPGWGPWTVKDGVQHVQPPFNVLEEMVTLRVHLDDANVENGCLKVLPYSQRDGLLEPGEIKSYVARGDVVSCEAKAGDILVMRPHILHSSSKAQLPERRRIIHLEYTGFSLPRGVLWGL